MLSRNQASRVTVARGSAVEMEVRRGNFRLSVFQDSAQDCVIQEQIEKEARVREGACRLLEACSQREQALEASKSLLTCSSRLLALMSHLQRMKETQALQRTGRRSSGGSVDERIPCTGKVAISDLRIPLMWKDSEYFKNKGELKRWAVFCLLSVGKDIYDTDLVIVDGNQTDICFEHTFIFADVTPDFQLRMELYSCLVEKEAFTPRRLVRLGGSLGRSSGKRLRAAMETAAACGPYGNTTGHGDEDAAGLPGAFPEHVPVLATQGPKYQLLAHTCLTLSEVQTSFRTHDLTIPCTEDSSFWLPLYGSVCCRMIAQPSCMIQQAMCGKMMLQQHGDGLAGCSELYVVLKGTELHCYHQQEDVEASVEPALVIPINKETCIHATENDSVLHTHSVLITNQTSGVENTHMMVTHTLQDTQSWMEAFCQHFYNLSRWKQCCDELMEIEGASRCKTLSMTSQLDSLRMGDSRSLFQQVIIKPLMTSPVVTEMKRRMLYQPGASVSAESVTRHGNGQYDGPARVNRSLQKSA